MAGSEGYQSADLLPGCLFLGRLQLARDVSQLIYYLKVSCQVSDSQATDTPASQLIYGCQSADLRLPISWSTAASQLIYGCQSADPSACQLIYGCQSADLLPGCLFLGRWCGFCPAWLVPAGAATPLIRISSGTEHMDGKATGVWKCGISQIPCQIDKVWKKWLFSMPSVGDML